MSMRIRLTLVVAVTFALVVIGCVYAAHVSASRQLRSAVDEFLEQRADRFTNAPPNAFPRGPETSSRVPAGGPALADPDAVTQILGRDGEVVSSISGEPTLPIDARDSAIAKGDASAQLRSVTVDGERFRMLTTPLPNGGAAQIARSIKSDDNVLGALDARLLLIALVGTVVAASLAWLIARRMVRPIERLTGRATYVADTQDLATPIEVTRRDEVGKLAESFNTMLEALHTSREQQKRLVVDASHELRTPLTALRTNIELLQRASAMDDTERAALLAEAGQELRELSALVGELVELATDTRADQPVEPVALDDVATRVVERYRRRTSRTLQLEVHEPATVDGRAALLDRAISNLVDNALKFSPPAESVAVSVDGARVEVLDRGPGVPPEDRTRVFDRFYRATTARSLPGSGLGLAIVKQIAELHHGTVAVQPREGGGTVASIDLTTSANGAVGDRAAQPVN